ERTSGGGWFRRRRNATLEASTASRAEARPPKRTSGTKMSDHPSAAARFLADPARVHWHDRAVWWIREKRDLASSAVPDWEALRSAAAGIKAHTLSRLAEYLEEFERNALALGAHVHWARDADEHNRIVHGLLRERGVARLVKSKSMLTEGGRLNPYLEARGNEGGDPALRDGLLQPADQPP